jgi:hypothetical protein
VNASSLAPSAPATPSGARPRVLADLAGLLGWVLAGATVGAAVGAAALGRNPSLQGPGQAGPWVAWIVAGYAAAIGALGLLATTLVRLRARPSAPLGAFAASWVAGAASFATFSAAQVAISTLTWRRDTHVQNVAASIAAASVAGVVVRLLLEGRLRPSAVKVAASSALLALGGGLGYAAFAAGEEPESADEPAPKVVRDPDARSRVMLIGIDGLDWARLRPLVGAGRLPAFRDLGERSYRGFLATRQPTWSPIVWNTIATGVPEQVHGVLDFTEVEIPGLERGAQRLYFKYGDDPLLPGCTGLSPALEALIRRGELDELPLTALHRRAKAFWNVLAEQGVRTGVVRWWASWPAEQIDGGYVVSDNDPMSQALGSTKSHSEGIHATLQHLTSPRELADELLPLIEPRAGDPRVSKEAFDALLARPMLADLTPEDVAELRDASHLMHWFDVIERGDRFAADCALELWNEKKVDTCAVYLRAVDTMSHRMWRFRGVIDRTYEFTDGLVAELVAAAGPDTTIVLVSDHGWCYEPGPSFAHNHGPPGVILIAGPDVSPGDAPAGSPGPTVLDVAPTLLAIEGLPQSAEMPGRALREAFRPGSVPARERPAVPSWGPYRPRWPAGTTSDVDRSGAVDFLRHLGYLDSEPSAER